MMDLSSSSLNIDMSMDLDVGLPSEPTTPVLQDIPGQDKLSSAQSSLQKRRSSTRSIKRKKFDDELVESSLSKTDRTRGRLSSASLPGLPPACIVPVSLCAQITPSTDALSIHESDPLTLATLSGSVSTPAVQIPDDAPRLGDQHVSVAPPDTPHNVTLPLGSILPPEKKRSKSSSKRSKKTKPPPAGSTKDLGRWKPQDDLALINAIQQTFDLTAVFHGVKFSCKFTLKEIQERWYALMYDSVLSKLAVQAMKQLHPDVIAAINTRSIFSLEEENLLKKLTSTSQPSLETFEGLLSQNWTVFHSGRTAKSLQNHWLLMKQYHLLPDQSVPPMPKGDHVLNFSDAEDMINDDELREPKDDLLDHELMIADRRLKREIRHVEQELPKWQVLVDSVTGISPPDFDNQTLAVLRGRLVRYLMRSREITLGRANKDNQIDVDLALEGPAWKISRKQGMIKLKNNGEFYIANEGKRPLYIDGKPIMMGNKQKLNNNSVVEISCLRFIFLINQDLINVIKQESPK